MPGLVLLVIIGQSYISTCSIAHDCEAQTPVLQGLYNHMCTAYCIANPGPHNCIGWHSIARGWDVQTPVLPPSTPSLLTSD